MGDLGETKEILLKDELSFWRDRLKNADNNAIEMLAQLLAEAEKAKQVLRNKGYGWTGLSLLKTVEEEVQQAIQD